MLFKLASQALTLRISALSQIENLCAISWALCLLDVSFSNSVSLSLATLHYSLEWRKERGIRLLITLLTIETLSKMGILTSHYRVVRYEFADQAIILRYAVEAYRGGFVEALMQADGIEDTDSGPLVRRHRNIIKGDLLSKTLPTSTPITVMEGGRCLPHAAILELTARGQHYSVSECIERKMPDAWISQTLNHHLCFHRETRARSSRSTVFDHVIHVPIAELLIDWEKNNAEKIHALAHVLGEVIKAARDIGSSCIVSCNGKKGAPPIVSRA